MLELKPLPPKEAIEYFRQKGYALSFDHRDVWQEQHQAGFTVAKVLQYDILQDIRQAADDALTNGTTYEHFAAMLTPQLKDKGWWGRKPLKDPLTGEVQDVQLGSPRRLKVIYDTNLRTAHSEGQWQRIQDNKDAFPYLEYDGKNSEHARLQHAEWDGLTLPVDHPFWQAHFPVKAYRCKCRVIARTARYVERSGRQMGPAPEVPQETYVNPRTGEVQQIPAGVHPSFHYPPGGRRASLNKHLVEKLESASPEMARASIADLVNGEAFEAWYSKPAGNFPLAYLDPRAAQRLKAKTQEVAISEYTLTKQRARHPELTIGEYALVQEVIDHGEAIQDVSDGSLIYVLTKPAGYVAVVKATRSGKAVFLSSFRKLSQEQAAREKLIQRLLRKSGKKGAAPASSVDGT